MEGLRLENSRLRKGVGGLRRDEILKGNEEQVSSSHHDVQVALLQTYGVTEGSERVQCPSRV
jgi:hypothetical protein